MTNSPLLINLKFWLICPNFIIKGLYYQWTKLPLQTLFSQPNSIEIHNLINWALQMRASISSTFAQRKIFYIGLSLVDLRDNFRNLPWGFWQFHWAPLRFGKLHLLPWFNSFSNKTLKLYWLGQILNEYPKMPLCIEF